MAIDTQIPPIIGNIVQAPSAQDFFLLKNYSNNYSWLPQSYVEAAIGSVNTIVEGTNINVDSTDPEHPIVSVVASPTFTTVTATTFQGSVATAHLQMVGTEISSAGTDASIGTYIKSKGASGFVVLTVNGNDILLATASHVAPGADNTYDLGDAALTWKDAYFGGDVFLTSLKTAATLTVYTNGADRWVFNSSGGFNPATDNTNDIGNGLVNPRDITVSRDIITNSIKEKTALAGVTIAPTSWTYLNSGIITRTVFPAYNTTYTALINDYEIAFTTGTGATGVDLFTTAFAIGQEIVVTDLDCIASTSNITVDAGIGNVIIANVAGGAQTSVISTDGASVKFKKMTATAWKVTA